MSTPITRRTAIRNLSLGITLAAGSSLIGRSESEESPTAPLTGRINHSVCKWCYRDIPLEDLCVTAKAIGLKSVELLQPTDFPVLQRHGLICAMVSNPTAIVGGVKVGGIPRAWNRPEYHSALVEAYTAQLNATAAAGFPNLICFSGNRDRMSDEKGLENCAIGLRRLLPLAEKLGVTLCMELLNSRVDHRDYMCDHTAWGLELVRHLASERFKLLYDIYHMQIMEGDVIRTIQDHHAAIAHYHTGGVPGRHEIDDTQELNYPAIMRAIAGTGFHGHVAQEFIPAKPDALSSLRDAVRICDI